MSLRSSRLGLALVLLASTPPAARAARERAPAGDFRVGDLEDLPWPDAAFDVVTARALGSLPVLCEYAAPLLREGGVLVAWKGAVDDAEEADGLAAAAILGLERDAVLAVAPYPGSERRTLHVFRKVTPTPDRYPRRPGMAAKRPLTIRSRRTAR